MFRKVTDAELIQKALAGSDRSWFTLVSRYERRLYNYTLRITGNPDDAMDVLQDILMSVYRNLASYRGDGVFAAWLFRIASFRSTDFLRRKIHRGPTLESIDMPDDARGQDIGLDNNRTLQTLLATLSNEQRQVIELKFFQHFTFEEISAQLGISSNTAKSRVYAALRKLRGSEPMMSQAGDSK